MSSKLEELTRFAAEAAVLKSGVVLDEAVYEPIVRAILEALREPTEEMLEVGACEIEQPFASAAAERCWQAMFDTILNEEGTE